MPFVTGMGHQAVRSLLAVSCLSRTIQGVFAESARRGMGHYAAARLTDAFRDWKGTLRRTFVTRSFLPISNHTRGLCGIGEARNGMLRRSATYGSRTPTVALSRRASYRWSTATYSRSNQIFKEEVKEGFESTPKRGVSLCRYSKHLLHVLFEWASRCYESPLPALDASLEYFEQRDAPGSSDEFSEVVWLQTPL
jgi:hypothetical protein